MKSRLPRPAVVDFETMGIEGRPYYPPSPVGVSIVMPGKKPRYYAWGHLEGNNCSWGEAREALLKAWECKEGLLFQNGKFDLDVAETHMELPLPEWDKVHDTLFLLFLDDPHQTELGLKPSSERLLDMPPDEQDEVADWLLARQPIPGVRISKSKQSGHYFGRYTAFAPAGIVGKYANGDTDRTEKLFSLLYPKTVDRGMLEAYNRERELSPILLEMERQGVPVDLERLRSDVKMYEEWKSIIDLWVIKTLKASDDINLDSGEQLVKAMLASGNADEALMPRTPTGKFQTNKEALLIGVTNMTLLSVLKYRTQLKTCLNTFMKPWLLVAEQSNGLIFTSWNQTKSTESGGAVGTRTGRLSSTPNFQNLPKEFTPIFSHDTTDKSMAKYLPKCPWKALPSLPIVRSYVIPFKGDVFIDRDYSQQEPRILAHFDGGALMDSYVSQPWIDFHDYAKMELEKVGKFYSRKQVKNTNLGLIYGMGIGKLAERNGMSVEEGKELKAAILTLYPGLKDMYKDMKLRAQNKQPIRTWGGREYYCEEPKFVDGRLRTFDYKLVNVLIQGSAADCTKEAIIQLRRAIKAAGKCGVWKILLNVHDQITKSVPKAECLEAMETLRVAMESVAFDVPMLSEGSISETNWAELKDYDKKGVVV